MIYEGIMASELQLTAAEIDDARPREAAR